MTKHRIIKFRRPKGFELPAKPRIGTPKTRKPCNYRETLQPGTVVILLAGPFAGRRAVFLRTLEAGLVVVSGIESISGVPMIRVNQQYLIATSTKLDLACSCNYFSKFNNDYFKCDRSGDMKVTDSVRKVYRTSDEQWKKDQVVVDKVLAEAVGDNAAMKSYLSGIFSLDRTYGVRPHELVF